MEVNYDLFVNTLFMKAQAKGIPLSGSFELTARCNFDCRMCYIHRRSRDREALMGEKNADWWVTLAKQAKEHGTLLLLLTGGEPLLRRDFDEIYTACKSLGLLTSVNTNGVLLDEDKLRLLREYPPQRVNISLYGASPETYGNNDPASYIAGEKNARYINVLGNLKSGGMTGSNDGKIAYVEGGSYDSLEFADYNNYQFGGPHNEVYLNKVTDGAVTGLSFTLSNFDKTKSQVMLSLRYVQKNGAANGTECKINNAIIKINSATEMYYDITEYVNDDGTVTIQNLGDNLLAVGYIKLADAKVSVDDSALAKAQRAMAQPGVETDVLARFIPVAENDAEEPDNVERPLGAELITVNGANNDNDGIVFDFLDTVLGSISAMFKKIASFFANIFDFFR